MGREAISTDRSNALLNSPLNESKNVKVLLIFFKNMTHKKKKYRPIPSRSPGISTVLEHLFRRDYTYIFVTINNKITHHSFLSSFYDFWALKNLSN